MHLWSRLSGVFRRGGGGGSGPAPSRGARPVAFSGRTPEASEAALRARLAADPNDVAAFATLAEIVRTRAHDSSPPRRYPRSQAADAARETQDAVWALAEELAHSPRAWFPLVELARLSIDDDREAAMRRLSTAAERDATGAALTEGLAMLRRAGHPVDALNLGVGHWRPHEHEAAAGRHMVEAALEAGRAAEARRHLAALAAREDADLLRETLDELEAHIRRAEPRRTIDVRDGERSASGDGRGRRNRR